MQLHVLAFAGPDPSARAWDRASRVTGLTQALAAMGFELPAPDTRGAFEARGRGRTVRSTVARWDSDKRWLLAMETVAALKRQHWHPLLMGYGRDTCNKWSQDVSGLKTVAYHDGLLCQLKLKSMAG